MSDETGPEAIPRLSAANTAAILVAAAQAPLGSTLIAVALPSIGTGTGTDLVLITGLLVTGYLVVNVICQGPAGKISDVVGHARVLWAGMGFYLVGAVCGVVAQGAALLFLSRCCMAAGGACLVPATLALLRLHVPHARRGRVFGLFAATMGVAAAGGPALGGEIVSTFGWRAVFLANLPFLGLSAVLLFLRPLPVRAGTRRDSLRTLATGLDYGGIGLLGLALALLVLASKLSGALLVATLIGALLIGIGFLYWEIRATDPILDARLFRRPAFAAGTLIIALQNFAMYGLLFQVPQFFSVFRDAAPREIGYLLFVMMIGMVVAGPIGGQLTDRIGAQRAAQAGAVLLLAGMAQLWALGGFDGPSAAFPALLVFGLGLGLGNAPAQSASMGAVDPHEAGMAASVSATMRYLGAIASIVVLGVVLGNDETVSIARHVVMVWLFTAAITLSALMTLRLPGRFHLEGRGA
ncbi:MFS transporter [Maribius pontilimi]|uniref:MFS transporter n=1 Tax=Palleronia pontilimi TaxID=1964209 RepID=A0A934IHM5_9RHOB|nr:MFS transporter [Palleronia pontilimi]